MITGDHSARDQSDRALITTRNRPHVIAPSFSSSGPGGKATEVPQTEADGAQGVFGDRHGIGGIGAGDDDVPIAERIPRNPAS
jgi:hypothetical protein